MDRADHASGIAGLIPFGGVYIGYRPGDDPRSERVYDACPHVDAVGWRELGDGCRKRISGIGPDC